MKTDEFPTLSVLLGSCLHQDWAAEFGTVEAAVEAFVGGENRATIDAACRELDKLLKAGLNEQELRRFIFALDCFYDPTADGLNVTQWLESVRARLRERLQAG